MQLNPDRKPTVILCGPGNNGGDGFVIARHLDNHNWPVHVVFAADRVPTQGDAAPNYTAALRADLLVGLENGLSPDGMALDLIVDRRWKGWIVDALFGTGLSRPLSQPHDWMVEFVNASRHPILAVDIPSGLDCDTGEPLVPCVKATHTATFVAAKRGFLNPNSRQWTGEVHVIDIGAPRMLVEEYRHRTNT
jgi:NAD(P)H-hydrate epimerase